MLQEQIKNRLAAGDLGRMLAPEVLDQIAADAEGAVIDALTGGEGARVATSGVTRGPRRSANAVPKATFKRDGRHGANAAKGAGSRLRGAIARHLRGESRTTDRAIIVEDPAKSIRFFTKANGDEAALDTFKRAYFVGADGVPEV